ncbi:Histone acetyltransferase HPA2 and related acetyltransferase [Lachnospiraceae bacterium TWA4]|nr:Histone acetyltransferase HPA2 and related acetyltransferase [Lachnospiraceae bacterium TWA4]
MKIRKATEKDFKRIMEIYAYARNFMVEHGNPNQWGPTNWPPEELIHSDIASKKSYVCENEGKVVGVFFYDIGTNIEPTYNVIDGQWIGEENYGTVHRIASDGTTKGVGSFCINWVFDQCGHIRMDTHEDNVVMQNLLEKIGFKRCGIIHVVEDNYPRIAYERIK